MFWQKLFFIVHKIIVFCQNNNILLFVKMKMLWRLTSTFTVKMKTVIKIQYLILCPFYVTMRSILLFTERIVLFTTSTGTTSNVLFTRVENDSKTSRVMASSWVMALWCNFLFTIWKIFSIGLRSWLLAVIVNFRVPTLPQAVLNYTLVCDESPSCQSNFPLGLADFLNMLAKYSRTKDEKFYALILPWYWSAAITPFL